MKVIVEGLIKDFLKRFEISDINFSKHSDRDFAKKLEYLVNYSFVSVNSDDDVSWETLELMDAGDTESIDGIALVVNGKVVTDLPFLEDLVEISDKLEVKVLVTQVKSSPDIDRSEINHFLVGVNKVLNLDVGLENENENVRNFREIWNRLFSDYIGKLKRIEINVLYASMNNKSKEEKKRIEDEIKECFAREFESIGSLFFNIWSLMDIRDAYSKTDKSMEVSLSVGDLLPFPEMKGVEDAYIGFIPYREFLKIVEDENGNFRGSVLFHDNPRDFLGYNEVNTDIKKTLEGGRIGIFPVLNNGITVVAEDLVYRKRNLYLKNFQIVNGCQTTHILYAFKDRINHEEFFVPVRFIATKNEDLKNSIIMATNNQTRIGKDELTALSDFQKLLENFYIAMNEKNIEKLYYERRKKQYAKNSNIPKTRIVDVKMQAKAFASMFLDLPHEASSYYGSKLTRRFGKQIFSETHRPYPYYISAFTLFKIMQIFNRRIVDTTYRKFKFHILMLIKYIWEKERKVRTPDFASPKIDKYCEDLFSVVQDENAIRDKLTQAISLIDKSGIDIRDKKELSKVETKNKLMKILNEM